MDLIHSCLYVSSSDPIGMPIVVSVVPQQTKHSSICAGDTWRVQNVFKRGFKKKLLAVHVEKSPNGIPIIFKYGEKYTKYDQRAWFEWSQDDNVDILLFKFENITSPDEGTYHIKFFVGERIPEVHKTKLTVIDATGNLLSSHF